MKMRSTIIAITLLAFAAAASAQTSVKLFDPVAIGASDPNVILNSNPYGMFRTAQVYLNCPNRSTSSVSGPDGGDLTVDNTLFVNSTNICDGNCFSLMTDPMAYLGMSVDMAYAGVAPINVRDIRESGLYTFYLLDFGYTYGSSAIYLNTTCSITPVNTPPNEEPLPDEFVICHRDNGARGQQTLTVGSSSISSHLANHGDTLGACAQ